MPTVLLPAYRVTLTLTGDALLALLARHLDDGSPARLTIERVTTAPDAPEAPPKKGWLPHAAPDDRRTPEQIAADLALAARARSVAWSNDDGRRPTTDRWGGPTIAPPEQGGPTLSLTTVARTPDVR